MATGFVLKFPSKVIADYKKATKRDIAYILNKKITDVGFKAAQLTPKEDPANIETELRKDKLALKMVTKKLTGKKGTTYTTRKGKVRTIKRVTRRQIALRTRQLISRRKKRTGFMRQGWVASLAAAGLRVNKGKIGAGSFRGKSKLGSGHKATAERPRAMLGNAVYGRMKGPNATRGKTQMRVALEIATAMVADETAIYARDKLAETAAKFSARRRR